METTATLTADIEEIVHAIWASLFDFPVMPDQQRVSPDEPSVTSVVHIDGAWHGAVLIQVPLVLATQLADAMFRSPDGAGLDEVRDALGELTNMLAGNLKALLPEPSSISLPAVALGSDYDVAVPRSRPVARVPFVCVGHSLVVTLVERLEASR